MKEHLIAKLEQKLADLKRVPETGPEIRLAPDWSVVLNMANDYKQWLVSDDYHEDGCRDLKTYIFEAVIEACFGKEFWPWANGLH